MKILNRIVFLSLVLGGTQTLAVDSSFTIIKTWKFDHASCSSSPLKFFNPYEPFNSVTLDISPTKVTESFNFTAECSFATISDYQLSGTDILQRISEIVLPPKGEDACGYNVNDRIGDVSVGQLFNVGNELQLIKQNIGAQCLLGEKVVYTFK